MKRILLLVIASCLVSSLYAELYFKTGFEAFETDIQLTRNSWVSELLYDNS